MSLTKNKIASIIAGVLGFVIAFFSVQYFTSSSNISKQMQEAAADLNTKLPIQTDAASRLDSVAAFEDHTYSYYYTLIDVEKAAVNMDTVNKYVKPELLRNARTNPELKGFRDHKITLDYIYYDKNGAYVTKITVTPENYENF
ncbi:hypothetical protein [Ascidiimonas sp. W6]|uniref:hypothetical protein n=1 Tax=Ascidiimonas meishanensis TaxID=3128903 RepID=UPI0030EBE27D